MVFNFPPFMGTGAGWFARDLRELEFLALAIIGLQAVRDQLSFTDDMAGFDDALLGVKLEAAQGMIERRLGFKLAARFGGVDQEPMPDALKEAVAMLAAHLYADREGREPFPALVLEVVNDFRDWTF